MAENESSYEIDDGIMAWFTGAEGLGESAEDTFRQAADGVLSYAKANAPWVDRTGDAREGLSVDVYTEGGDVILDLYHTVDYGLWLEVIQNGNFAIIMPTLERFAPMIFADAGARVTSISGEE